MVAVVIKFNGTYEEVDRQKRVIYGLLGRFGGIIAGADYGRKSYFSLFVVAYFRDWALSRGVVGDSIETTVPWSEAMGTIKAMREIV